MPDRYVGRHLGRFRIDELVGSGGFAWVYRGWDPELDIPVALKVLKPQYAGDEGFESRFRREALTASHLRHPNIIRILGVGRDGDAVYFAMDYVPQNLSARLRVMKTIPEPLLAQIGIDVAAALAFAHREGVVHRDVKTDNILFDDHGNALVADFGIARASSVVNEETATNMVVGTPQYFSPEQARGLSLDGRSDVYSLGVTLYRAATGVLPFTGDDWYDIARQQIEDAPRKPSELNTTLSAAFEQIILRCLAKQPAQRYDSADALRLDLLSLSSRTDYSETSTAPYQPAVTAPISSMRVRLARHRVVIGTGLAAVVLLVATSARIRGNVVTPGTTGMIQAPPFTPSTVPVQSPVPPAVLAGTTPAPGPRIDTSIPAPLSAAPRLQIFVPADAQISLDGRSLGRGDWRTDNAPIGSHWIVASVASLPGCATARDSERVSLARGGVSAVHLAPQACAMLTFNADSAAGGARFALSTAGHATVTGVIPSPSLVLPVGNYQLRVSKPLCAEYNAEVMLRPDSTVNHRFALICASR